MVCSVYSAIGVYVSCFTESRSGGRRTEDMFEFLILVVPFLYVLCALVAPLFLPQQPTIDSPNGWRHRDRLDEIPGEPWRR